MVKEFKKTNKKFNLYESIQKNTCEKTISNNRY